MRNVSIHCRASSRRSGPSVHSRTCRPSPSSAVASPQGCARVPGPWGKGDPEGRASSLIDAGHRGDELQDAATGRVGQRSERPVERHSTISPQCTNLDSNSKECPQMERHVLRLSGRHAKLGRGISEARAPMMGSITLTTSRLRGTKVRADANRVRGPIKRPPNTPPPREDRGPKSVSRAPYG